MTGKILLIVKIRNTASNEEVLLQTPVYLDVMDE